MLEILHSIGGQKGVFYDSGPGPIALEFGDIELGFFGEVSQSELFTPAQINAALQNLPGATVVYPNSVWLKFAYKRKFLFIAKQPMFGSLNWNALYDNGLIYGTDDSGMYNSGKFRNQIRLIGKNSFRFKMRTITGDEVDPSELPIALDNTVYRSSEVTELLYRVYRTAIAPYPEKFANYTEAEMGTHDGYEITRETLKTNASDNYLRGSTSIARVISDSKARSPAIYRWRPVLELVPPSVIFSIQQPSTAAFGEATQAAKVSSVVSISEEGLQRLTDIVYSTSGTYSAPAFTSLVQSGNHAVASLGVVLVDSDGDFYGAGGLNVQGSGVHAVSEMDVFLTNSAEFVKPTGAVKGTVSN